MSEIEIRWEKRKEKKVKNRRKMAADEKEGENECNIESKIIKSNQEGKWNKREKKIEDEKEIELEERQNASNIKGR